MPKVVVRLRRVNYNPKLQEFALGGCPRIAIFSKIKDCEKNYRRHMVAIPRIIF